MKKRNFAIKITLSFRPTRHIKVKSLKEIEEVLEKSWSRMAVSKVWCLFTVCVLLSLVVVCYSDDTDADAPIETVGNNAARVLLSAREDSMYNTQRNRQRKRCGFWRRIRGKC